MTLTQLLTSNLIDLTLCSMVKTRDKDIAHYKVDETDAASTSS